MADLADANPAPGFAKHPNYAVTLQPVNEVMTVEVDGQIIGESRRAVQLLETKHRPVWYMPLQDLKPELIEATSTQTYCPFKGYASYWSVVLPELTVDDAIWAYMTPYDECTDITGFASFYTNKVDLKLDGVLANKDGPGWTS